MTVEPPTEEMRTRRAEIDAIDVEIARLLGERFAIVRKVAAHKKENGIAAVLPDRIDEVIKNVRQLGKEKNVDPDLMEAVYRVIIKHACDFEDGVISS